MSAEPRRLVLLRHGRTAWNAEGRAQGHADVELDEVGHAQAAAVAPWVARWCPTVLVSSDLARARQTAAYVEKETGLTLALDARLREYDVGDRTGLTMPEFAEQFPEEHAAWRADRRRAVLGAEGPAEVAARIVPACQDVLAALQPGDTAVLVTHGAALKVAVLGLLGWPQQQADSLRVLDNCAVALLEQVEQLDQAPSFRLVAWNLRPTGVEFASGQGGG